MAEWQEALEVGINKAYGGKNPTGYSATVLLIGLVERILDDAGFEVVPAKLDASDLGKLTRYEYALRTIRNLMGPPNSDHTKKCITCEGCLFEWEETLQIVENVLSGKEPEDHWVPVSPEDWNITNDE